MAGGNVTISSNLISFPAGTLTEGPLSFSIPNPVLQINSVTFGSATFISTSGPTGATSCFIVPPTGNTTSLTLKGITGDTGIPLNPSGLNFLTFPSSTTPSVGIASGAAVVGTVVFIWA